MSYHRAIIEPSFIINYKLNLPIINGVEKPCVLEL